MLPKVTIPEQPAALALLMDSIEAQLKLPKEILKIEMMVETTQSIMSSEGTNPLRKFILASKGRCIAIHFGTYDYTASCSITARYQETVYGGEQFLNEELKKQLLNSLSGHGEKQLITRREKEILKLILEENTNQQIADKLFLSLRTVENHRNNLLQKLNAKNTAGLVKIALQEGLV